MSYQSSKSKDARRTITPTDVTSFIRLEQCERNLRLQIHTRNGGSDFWKKNQIVPQTISPLLSLYGGSFESEIEAGFEADPSSEPVNAEASFGADFDEFQLGSTGLEYSQLGEGKAASRRRMPDNARVLQEIEALPVNTVKLLLQSRLRGQPPGQRRHMNTATST